MADGGTGEKFRGVGGVVIAVLRLAEITEGANGDVAMGGLGLVDDGKPLRTSDFVILHLAGVDVQITENADAEFIG